MKTTTANFDAEKNKLTGARLRYLVEIVTSGGTVYYSDQDLSVEAQAYITKVLNWGRMVGQLIPGDDVVRIGNLSLQLVNFPRIDADIFPGDEIRFYVWFLDLVEADKLLIFKGNISDDISWSAETISFRAKDKGKFFDKLIGQPLSSVSFPNADPDDLGKTIPIVYGDVKNHQCLAIEAGAATTLSEDIDDSVTIIPVTSTISPIAFPASGSILIGTEEISYTAKTDDAFGTGGSPAIRGVGATDNVSHSLGDAVLENVASIKYLAADHVVKEMTNPRILPFGLPLNEAVLIDAGSVTFNIDDSGKATVTLTDLLVIRKSVSVVVTQQPSVSLQQKFSGSTDHSHEAPGNETISYYNDSLTTSQTGGTSSNLASMVDGNFVQSGAINGYTSFDYDFVKDGITTFSGEVKRIKAKIKANTSKAGGMDIKMKLYHEGVLKEEKDITVPQLSPTVFETAFYAVDSGFDWLDFNDTVNNHIQIISDESGFLETLWILEVWYEVEYLPGFETETIQDGTIATTGGTEVQIGGDSVAASLGGVLIIDIEGYKDDNPAHYTDVADSLIEEPWDVMHHLIENHSNGAVDADIDLTGSFQDAEDNLPADYKFAFAIIDQRNLNRLLAQLAVQTYCRFVWEAGAARLLRIKTSGSPDKSIDTDDDTILKNGKLDIRMRRRGLNEIVNNVEIKYNLNLTLGGWSVPDAYEGTTNDNDATSIAAYGERSKTYLMYAVGDNSSMADDLRDKYLALLKDPRREITFTTFMKNIEIERGDLLSITSSQFGLSSILGEVINTEFLPGINPEYRIICLIPVN